MKIIIKVLLNEQFKEILNYKLTYINAPLGYGKTTALKNYTNRLKNVDIINISMEFNREDHSLFHIFRKQILTEAYSKRLLK